MSLGIAFKGPEGIVLAADSRVTLTTEHKQDNGKIMVLPSTYDNATKLLRLNGQDFVGVVTYGLGGIGSQSPRTAHSFMPELENELTEKNVGRLSIIDFSQEFSDFFMRQWRETMPENFNGPPMTFLIGGYNEKEPYGKVYRIAIPYQPIPEEQNAGMNNFGITWGGQMEYTSRIIKGYDPSLPNLIKNKLQLTDEQTEELTKFLNQTIPSNIPYQFLPLQDCVDLSMFLIQMTREMQTWQIGVRGVGGAIDIATITRTDGFQPIQIKKVKGKRNE